MERTNSIKATSLAFPRFALSRPGLRRSRPLLEPVGRINGFECVAQGGVSCTQTAHWKHRTLMPAYRSRTTTHGRNMAGARGLWRATGMKDSDFGKPIIAVVNSFTQFVPGHVHLKDLGQMVAREIEAAGGVAKE